MCFETIIEQINDVANQAIEELYVDFIADKPDLTIGKLELLYGFATFIQM